MQPIDCLRQQFAENGEIPFVAFMQQALYSPEWGYYNQKTPPVGAAGDFITAPELTPLFGYTLANQCAPILKALATPSIFEFGAGTGRLCIDILTHLETFNCLPEAYHILEVSGALKSVQMQHIEAEIPHLKNLVQWHTSLPDNPFEGIILANEVLDAMPVHRFLKTDSGIFESMIGFDAQNALIETFEPCTNDVLKAHVNRAIQHNITPYASEANLFIEGWIKACFAALKRGVVLLIDYGFPQHEYYHPDRREGTLMCHYQHKAHPNPLLHPGKEDITAHVNFTHVADSALNAGFEVTGYTNQAAFLLANGLLSLLDDSAQDTKAHVHMQQAIKTLTHPSEMGELFKVMGLAKAFEMPLVGFQFHDKRASLDR